jgi:undecaprenyl-diphosphatase
MKLRSLFIALFLGIALPLVAFGDIAIAVWQKPIGFNWDKTILLAIHRTATPELDYLAPRLTGLGTEWGVLPATAILLVIFALKKYRYGLGYLALMMGGGWAISYNLKVLFHRARPSFWEGAYPLPLDFAFPSGHALFSSLLVIALAVLSWRSRWFLSVLAVGIPFVLGIAWTRLYLGVHFPSDILGSWFLAIAWSSIVSLILSRLSPESKAIENSPES